MKKYFIIVSLILAGCQSSEVKELKFKKDLNEIIRELNSSHDFKQISIKSGKHRWEGGGGFNDAILIDLTFEKNASQVEDTEAWAEEKMRLVVNNVSNKSDFMDYVVSFYSETINGSDTSSTRIMSYIFSKSSFELKHSAP